MAGVLIEVDTQQLERDKETVKERLMQVEQSLKRVYELVEELDAMWDGPANLAFRQQFANDRESFEEMCREVKNLIESLAYAKMEYEKCENQVKAAVAAIRI